MSLPTASAPEPEPPGRLESTFADQPLSAHAARWSSLWRDSYTPWDRGGPSMALHDLLLLQPDLFPPAQKKKKRALVPGCGRGYDVLLLASFGYDAFGLDVSAEATREAAETERRVLGFGFGAEEEVEKGGKGDGSEDEDVFALKEGVRERGSVVWLTGDFFSDEWLEMIGGRGDGFDLIFDYTFLCALPPSARPRWARRMSDLLARPDGRLVCLEWPLHKPPTENGPPWGLAPEVYEAHLSRPGEEVASYDAERRPGPSDGALKRLARVQPARTHPAGCEKEGERRVIDRISVWGHV